MATNLARLHPLYAHPRFLELYKKNLMDSMEVTEWTYLSSEQRKWAARLLAFQDLYGTRDNRFPEWEYKPIFDAGLEETRIRLQQVQNTTMQIPAPITPATVTPATLASATIMPAADTPGARTPVSVSLVGGGSGGTNQPVLSFREVTGSHIEVILVNNIQTINTTGTSRGRHRGRGSSRGNLQGDRRGTGGGEQNSLHAARVNVMTGPAERGTDLAINDVNEWPNLPAAALPSRR